MGELLGVPCLAQAEVPHRHTGQRGRRGREHLLQESKPVRNFIEREIGIFPRVDLSSCLPALEAERTPVSWPQECPSSCNLSLVPASLPPRMLEPGDQNLL